jgi:hypothetical protein
MHVMQATNLLVVNSQVVEVHLTSLGFSYVGEVFGQCLNFIFLFPFLNPICASFSAKGFILL